MILLTSYTQDVFLTMGNVRIFLPIHRYILLLHLVYRNVIIRGTDLSAGRLVGMSAIITGTLVQKPDFAGKFFPDLPNLPIIVPLLIVLLIGTIFGLLNGIIIAFFHVPPFLATLGTQIMIYGLNMLYSKNKQIGTFKPEFLRIGKGKFLGFIPYITVIAAVVGIIMHILYTKTRYGKYMYAIGGNEEAAEVSGVNVRRSKLKIFALAGFLYGLAGFSSAKTGSVGQVWSRL